MVCPLLGAEGADLLQMPPVSPQGRTFPYTQLNQKCHSRVLTPTYTRCGASFHSQDSNVS